MNNQAKHHNHPTNGQILNTYCIQTQLVVFQAPLVWVQWVTKWGAMVFQVT